MKTEEQTAKEYYDQLCEIEVLKELKNEISSNDNKTLFQIHRELDYSDKYSKVGNIIWKKMLSKSGIRVN